ncbi:hypothetical protein EW146_g4280 [Bondarzewia mesenterica]|uniref:Protein transport protein sec16 n=1 Tax=Bondarzewia mesenterica TaxID=1095465 RepID=A0A4S4LW48_9AGAM|nr:hypothetical protein EW146_g4280 [Bondarzewia mesenterica]
MGGVEAAASLFGLEDASDPFDVIGGNDEAVSQNATRFSDQNMGSSAADLFGGELLSGQEYGMGFSSNSGAQGDHLSWNDTTGGANSHTSSQHDYSQSVITNGSGYYQPQVQANGDGQGSNAYHGGGQSYTDYSQTQYATHDAGVVQQSYNPASTPYTTDTQQSYAPHSHGYSPLVQYSNASMEHSTNDGAQSAYNPYKPNTTTTTQPAAPSNVTSTASYNPYSPSAYASPPSQYSAAPSATTSAYATSPYISAVSPPVVTSPAPTAEQFRPKTFDAYDPPMPPPKPIKRVTLNASAHPMSPTVGQTVYSTYDSPSAVYPGTTAPPFRSMSNPRPPNGITSPLSHVEPPPPASHASYQRTMSPPNSYDPPIIPYHHPPVHVHHKPPLPVTYQSPPPAHYPSSPPTQYQSPPQHYQPALPPAVQHQPDQHEPLQSALHPSSLQQTKSLASPEILKQTSTLSSPYASYAGPTAESHDWTSRAAHLRSGSYGHADHSADHSELTAKPLLSPTAADRLVEESTSQLEQHRSQPAFGVNHDDYDPEAHAFGSNAGINSFVDHTVADSELGDTAWTSIDVGKATPRTTGVTDNFAYSPPLPSSSQPITAPPSSAYDAYKPTSSAGSPQVPARVLSPGSPARGSARSSSESHRTRTPEIASPPAQTSAAVHDPYHPTTTQSYEPKSHASRVSSPVSVRSWKSRTSVHDAYAPDSFATRERSMSNGSAYSMSSVMQASYVPQHPRQPSELSQSASYSHTSHLQGNGAVEQSQTLMISGGSTYAPYAPSPSLLGTNDPLGRITCRAPLISFGFGGKMVTCFHGSSTLNTGFDVALSSRQTTSVQVRLLREAIPQSALDNSSSAFPGPLFCDPGSPTTSLVRTTVATQTKTNKARVIKYLEERADEMSRGLGYLSKGSPERRQAEGKLVLVKLLKVMVENDGHLSGGLQVESAVRAALVARLSDTSLASSSKGATTTSTLGFAASSDSLPVASEIPYPSLGLSVVDPNDTVVATSNVKSSSLDKIQDFLIRGDRRQAVHYALDEKLWAHAMVIASSIDKEAWKEVVSEFIKTEVGSNGVRKSLTRSKEILSIGGRESLKVAYSLYAGQGAAAVQELAPPSFLPRRRDTLQVPPASHITPMSPNFPSTVIPTSVPMETLGKWTETAAMMIPGPSIAESSAALMALGDCLLANQWTEAAHACYLLAPQTSAFVGLGSPSNRIVLLGSRNPLSRGNLNADHDPIIFSEIVEFAMSLSTPQKGKEIFAGFPHLQAYKLIRAASLAELGHIQAANRYCEAIASSLRQGSASINPAFVEQLKGLSDRLVAAPQLDKSGSWMGNKMSRPSLDSIGNWLEGRLTKFIAGDGDGSPPTNNDGTNHEPKGFSGPFSHYSTISSATSSTSPSPQPSMMNFNVLPGSQSYRAPPRSGSAQAMRPLQNPQIQIDRASSAMDYRPKKSSPVPRIASASAATTSFAQATYGYTAGPYGYSNGMTLLPGISDVPSEINSSDANSGDAEDSNEEQTVTSGSPWWGSSFTEESSATTPTAATFYHVDGSAAHPSTSGFISLMDGPTNMPAVSPPPSATLRSAPAAPNEDDEDLGFGNFSIKRKQSDDETDESKPAETAMEKSSSTSAPARPDLKHPGTGSWFSRWWKGGEGNGPVKATLGEENSFYYDKELKRWTGSDAAKPVAPPPPPSRAQTASPGRSAPRMPDGTTSVPPPARPASAIDLTTSPTKRSLNGIRTRSNLVPMEEAPSPAGTPPPMSSGTPPPPPGRPKSQSSKRNVRSRYVDVFQQP